MILPCRRTASVLQYPRQFLKEGNVLKELLDLYFTFFKLGAVTFGGGYAMLPILQREVVEKKHWATDEELMDYYAIGQCTPGIIAAVINNFADILWVQNALGGIRVCVCVFILNSVVKLFKSAVKDKVTLAMYLLAFAVAVFFNFSPIYSVVIAGVLGVLFTKLGVRGK